MSLLWNGVISGGRKQPVRTGMESAALAEAGKRVWHNAATGRESMMSSFNELSRGCQLLVSCRKYDDTAWAGGITSGLS